MPFREPRIRQLRGSVAYGPFPLRAGRVGGPLAFLIVALGLGVMAIDEDRLVCTPAASCVVTHRLAADPPPFPASTLRDVTVEIERGSKNQKYGAVYLVLDGGMGRLRLTKTDPDRAADVAARIRAALAAGRPVDERVRGPWWAFIAALGLLAGVIAMTYSTLRGMGRIRLDVVHGGAALRVQRFVFGMPLAPRDVSLDGVVDVHVERGDIGETLRARGEGPTPAGRIFLVDRHGQPRPLTDRLFPGVATHLRAAAALRALLELPPQRGGVEEQLAAMPLVTTSLGMRIAYSWIGVTVGGLLGLGLYAIVGLSIGALRARDGPDGLAFAAGFGGGAVAGVALVFYLTRTRPPR